MRYTHHDARRLVDRADSDRGAPTLSIAAGSDLGRRLFSEQTWRTLAAELGLSPRELEVLKGIFDDRKEASIGHQLGISPHTVHTYVERIYAKLSVKSRVETVTTVVAAYHRQHDPGRIA